LRYSLTSAAALLASVSSAVAAPAVDPLAFGPDSHIQATPPVEARHGMVVSAQHLATDAGARIMAQGGNAIDAAVAVGYALAVVYPAAGNIGGGGFMTLHVPGHETIFIDFREHAPLAATKAMYQDAQGNVVPGMSTKGWKAVAVPGTVAGLDMIQKKWGRLTRAQVMAPAIALARDGFVLEQGDIDLLNRGLETFRQDPYAKVMYLRPDGSPLQLGDRLVQTDLARSLASIAKDGPQAFYKGAIAREIVRTSRAGGGILQPADFTAYHTRVLQPITCQYRGFQVETAPPPSAGGVALCEILNILSGDDMHALGLHTVGAVQQEIEAMRHTYSDRQDLGDPAFVNNPVAHLTDPAYARAVLAGLPRDHAVASDRLVPGQALPGPEKPVAADDHEKHETTQYSIMDDHGAAVSVTYTLNGWFGSGRMAGHTGIWMNDEMDDFSSKPGSPNMFGIVGSDANAIAPGKTPLSSMSPTILSRDGKPVMVIGSPGGSRIPTITLSAILGVVDYGLDIQQAVDLPRIHEQWMPEAAEVEQGAISRDVETALNQEGYQIVTRKWWGVAEGVLAGGPSLSAARTGLFYGGVDHRHPGGEARGD